MVRFYHTGGSIILIGCLRRCSFRTKGELTALFDGRDLDFFEGPCRVDFKAKTFDLFSIPYYLDNKVKERAESPP